MKGFFFVVSFTETCIYKGERTFESGIVGNLGNNRESREGVAADAATSIYGECAQAGDFWFRRLQDGKEKLEEEKL